MCVSLSTSQRTDCLCASCNLFKYQFNKCSMVVYILYRQAIMHSVFGYNITVVVVVALTTHTHIHFKIHCIEN